MTVDQIYDIIKECYDSNCNTQSVINWNFLNNLPMSKVNVYIIILIFNVCKI